MLASTPSLWVTTIFSTKTSTGLGGLQAKVAQQVASTAPDVVKTLNVVYFPQLGRMTIVLWRDPQDITSSTGFLICVPMLEEWSSAGQINDLDGWTFQVRDDHDVSFAPI